jgi:hypothetical protein
MCCATRSTTTFTTLKREAFERRAGRLIPQCEECRKVWLPVDRERWQARWIDDGGPDELLIFHCPEWSEREFGSSNPGSFPEEP